VTEYDTLEDLTGAEDRSEFHERGIYFQDDSLDKILGRVID
jgi:hypothetical protein